MATIRYRGEKNILDTVKNLDAFRKVPEEYTETTEIGGTLSLLSRFLILILIYNEIYFYQDCNLLFSFEPDVKMDDKITMQVDITVATPCLGLSGVDLVDETQQEIFSYGTLKRDSTWWELGAEQRLYFDHMKNVNAFLREEYHSVSDLIFKDILQRDGVSIHQSIPKRKRLPDKAYDACRLHGTLTINKVAGVLHIIVGDSLNFGFLDHHWHSNNVFANAPHNFSHRINKLSFGDFSSRIVQPLEGDERFVNNDSTVIQYFIQIVPTELHNFFSTVTTFQYSVKENFRSIDSRKNSYGLPGIYFKYDWSALKVIVRRDRDNIIQFVVRLCSIISGIVVISGILNSVIQMFHKYFLRLIAPQIFTKSNIISIIDYDRSSEASSSAPPTILVANDLIVNANKMSDDVLCIKALPQ